MTKTGETDNRTGLTFPNQHGPYWKKAPSWHKPCFDVDNIARYRCRI